MSYKEKINMQRLPEHVAIIMDGNGRWAAQRGFDRLIGHQNGVAAVRESIEAAAESGIKFLSLYAFSTENWERPKDEVDGLMALLSETLVKEIPTLNKNNIRLHVIGDLERMPLSVQEKINDCLRQTQANTGLGLVLALSYSSRWEICNAVKEICTKVQKGEIKPEELDTQLISDHLNTSHIPDPDLLIRTSGEQRISNFLLWQLAYSELFFTDTHWPDFKKENFYQAIYEYQKRERRFGK